LHRPVVDLLEQHTGAGAQSAAVVHVLVLSFEHVGPGPFHDVAQPATPLALQQHTGAAGAAGVTDAAGGHTADATVVLESISGVLAPFGGLHRLVPPGQANFAATSVLF